MHSLCVETIPCRDKNDLNDGQHCQDENHQKTYADEDYWKCILPAVPMAQRPASSVHELCCDPSSAQVGSGGSSTRQPITPHAEPGAHQAILLLA